MRCMRCTGLMVAEQGWISHDQEIPFTEYRCLNCGNIEDIVIVRNRRESLSWMTGQIQ